MITFMLHISYTVWLGLHSTQSLPPPPSCTLKDTLKDKVPFKTDSDVQNMAHGALFASTDLVLLLT